MHFKVIISEIWLIGAIHMTLVNYIGCNIKVPIINTGNDNTIYIGTLFSNKDSRLEIQEFQYSTKYVYEVTYDSWGIELSKYQDDIMYNQAKKALHELCEWMNNYLAIGDYFEFYTCWVGEESYKYDSKIILPITNFYQEDMEIRAQTFVRFLK